jgi:succinate dehydrogenase cytochrome b556 subunit
MSQKPGNSGMIAWLLQRITGLLLVAYLATHLWVNHFSHITTPLDDFFLFLLGDKFLPVLLALLTYHALNGFRVFAIDFGIGARGQKLLFWGLVVLGGAIFFFWVFDFG